MRKHFLILMLLALLPLAGWAATTSNVTIQCANITYYYGATNIPANGAPATADMIGIVANPDHVNIADIAAALTFERLGTTSTAVKEDGYAYRLVKKIGYTGDVNVTITGGNGTLYINKRPVTLTADNKEKDFGAVNPEFTATLSGEGMAGTEQLTYTVTRTSTSETAGDYTNDLVVNVTENEVSANYDITTVKGKFTIKPLKTGDATKLSVVLASTDPIVYSGLAKEPALTVTYDGNAMALDTDYAVVYGDNTNASTAATATVTLKNYVTPAEAAVTKGLTFTITPRSLGTDGKAAEGVTTRTTSSFPNWIYTGTEKSAPGSALTQVKVDGVVINKSNYDRTFEGDRTNATAGVAEADKPYFLFTGKGNYTGSVKLYVTIAKAPLTVTADDKSKPFGTADPAFTVTYDGFVAGETADTEGVLGGTLAFDSEHSENPGIYDITPKGLTAKNYEITFVPGKLTINPAGILVIPDALSKTYGEEDPELTYTISPASLKDKVDLTSVHLTREDGNTPGEYTIYGTAESNDSKYEVTVSDEHKLTINKATLTIRAKDQIIALNGDMPEWATVAGKYTVDGYAYEDDAAIIATEPTLACETSVTTTGGQFAITPSAAALTTEAAANYDIEYKNGTLSIIGAGATFTLSSDPDGNAAALIDELGNLNVNVKINFAARNTRTLGEARTWAAENWNTLVLPFDITVADLSKAFGYAIVNVINPDRTKINAAEGKSEFYGKMTMKGGNGSTTVLQANKPIIIKTADPVVGVVDFGTQNIVAPGTEDDALSVDAGCDGDVQFVGTYKKKTVTKADNAKVWFYVGNYAKWAYIGSTSDNTWDILPFEAYIDFSALSATVEALDFYVEDFDGSTTAIKNINGDNANVDVNGKLNAEGWFTLNGVKLQGAPTQKGIYINNGKKVVIK